MNLFSLCKSTIENYARIGQLIPPIFSRVRDETWPRKHFFDWSSCPATVRKCFKSSQFIAIGAASVSQWNTLHRFCGIISVLFLSSLLTGVFLYQENTRRSKMAIKNVFTAILEQPVQSVYWNNFWAPMPSQIKDDLTRSAWLSLKRRRVIITFCST